MKENSEQNRKGGEAIGRRSRIKTKWKPEEKGEKMRHRRKRCLKECIDNMAASKFRSGTKGERNWFGEKKKNTILSLNCVLSCKTFHQAFWKDNPTPTPPFQCLSKDMLFFLQHRWQRCVFPVSLNVCVCCKDLIHIPVTAVMFKYFEMPLSETWPRSLVLVFCSKCCLCKA